jgi:hypothetical protein
MIKSGLNVRTKGAKLLGDSVIVIGLHSSPAGQLLALREEWKFRMGKQKKAKARRREQRMAIADPGLSWHDEEGIHLIAPGDLQPGDEKKLTANLQKQIRNSLLWGQMVDDFGEEKADELLKQFKAQIKK